MSWLQIRLNTSPEKQEQLEDSLLAAGAASVTYQDGADQPILEPGLNETPLWDQLVLTALFTADIDTKAKVAEIEAIYGSQLPAHQVEILEDKDWVREWMDSYHPIQFGERLWICPSWREAPDPDATNLLLDPGLAFGTGTHPTTAMCLRQLDKLDVQDKTVIDYGCGSGILAIAALLLGAKSAIAIDIDPQALSATRDNAERNGIPEEKLQLFLAGEEPELPADLMLANILAGPLVELSDKLQALTHPDGEIILSGVLNEQREAITQSYRAVQFTDYITEQEWLCLQGRRIK